MTNWMDTQEVCFRSDSWKYVSAFCAVFSNSCTCNKHSMASANTSSHYGRFCVGGWLDHRNAYHAIRLFPTTSFHFCARLIIVKIWIAFSLLTCKEICRYINTSLHWFIHFWQVTSWWLVGLYSVWLVGFVLVLFLNTLLRISYLPSEIVANALLSCSDHRSNLISVAKEFFLFRWLFFQGFIFVAVLSSGLLKR